MARKGDEEQAKKFQQFNEDVNLLHDEGRHTFVMIANKMGIEDSNLANYRNGTHPITKEILNNFNIAWAEELEFLYKKRGVRYIPNSYPETVTGEKDSGYAGKNYTEAFIVNLQKTNSELLKSTQRLVKTNEKLAETNKKLVDAHISFLGQQGGETGNRLSSSKQKDDSEIIEIYKGQIAFLEDLILRQSPDNAPEKTEGQISENFRVKIVTPEMETGKINETEQEKKDSQK